MSESYDPQHPSMGAGQVQELSASPPQNHPPYETTNLPPPPSHPPLQGMTTEQHPPLPPRPASNVPQVTYTAAPPISTADTLTCPRCSYHNHAPMRQCEMCELDLQAGVVPQTPYFPPPPGAAPPRSSHQFGTGPNASGFAPPPQRQRRTFAPEDDPSDPVHYARDPHKLVAYIIPLPTPTLPSAPTKDIPKRFLIYTPPPPPLKKPELQPGQKEDRLHMVQRKWEDQLRKAKNSEEKSTSFKGIHHKMVRATNKGMSLTTSSNLDFLGRASPGSSRPTTPERKHADDGVQASEDMVKTVPVDEMLFIYPTSMGTDEVAIREEFVNTLMRTKSKAQRDSVIATGLVPVGFGIDFLLVVVGGLGEIATVWAFKSIMGAKTARSISKRLASSNGGAEGQLKLSFKPSDRMETLKDYLDAECNRVEPLMFPRTGQYHIPPIESNVIEAIGWSPHQSDGETRNWEDEQWELSEVKEDFKITMHKGAKEWRKYCQGVQKEWDKKEQKERSERNEQKYLNQ